MTSLDPLPAWVLDRREAIGALLRDARLRAGLTQASLGERVGLDHKTIHRIEYAASDPSLSDLLLIAAELQLHLGDLET